MPENISISEFLKETWDDYNSPTTSSFVGRMGHCKNTVGGLEETLDFDRSGLTKMKKSVKALFSSGTMHVTNESYLAENLEKLGANALHREHEPDIGAAFLKFAVVTKELSALMKNLMQNLNNIVMFPLDSFLKGDLRGVKGDLKKPFDKAWKEYDSKFSKIEKEKKQLAKEAGMLRTEVSGAEIAEEMEKERRMFQLQMCEYLIKVNEIKTKKGVDLLQHFVEYYQAQTNYFQDGLKTIEHFHSYIDDLVLQLTKIKSRQDHERKQLQELKDALKNTLTNYKETCSNVTSSMYSLHQLQGNKLHGCEKKGNLLKKSEGKMRKVWQKRRCMIKDGFLSICHSDLTKEPVKLNLLTCQVKLVHDDPGKKCFDLISSSKNRTYHFQAEDSQDMEEWISVLNNAKEAVLLKAFGESAGPESSPINQSVKELTRTIIDEVKRLPGNRYCCDCTALDPQWLSVNLGVLICLECCGVHREMGVHISRTQSIIIDDLGTSQLLLARVVSNRGFNDIMEATLDIKQKPTSSSTMEERKNFIRAKYERRRFAIVTCTNTEDLQQDLRQAVLSKDIFALLQVFAEGIDFMAPLPDTENEETALHLAVRQEDGISLHMVDFMLQNTNNQYLHRGDCDGNTLLHLCASHNQTEIMKLLLRIRGDLVDFENMEGETAMDIARDRNYELCTELLKHALSGRSELFENVNIDWDLISDDHIYDNVDYSDDDLDGSMTPDRKSRSRPGSLIMSADSNLLMGLAHRDRSHTAENLKCSTLPPPPPPASSKPKFTTLQMPNRDRDSNTLTRKKGPAPLPPEFAQGHSRNPSDPPLMAPRGSNHTRSPSDPPPLPSKAAALKAVALGMPGAKLVLPPPPEFRSLDQGFSDPRPRPAPRGSRTPTPTESDGSRSLASINGQSRSSDSLDSTDLRRSLAPVKLRRCRALYDCEADNEDELSFQEGEIILILKEEEEEWWEGQIERQPHRRGMFPAPFVELLSD